MTGPQPDLPPEPGPDDPARITPEDVERAKLRWRQVAPAGLEDLLDAGTEA